MPSVCDADCFSALKRCLGKLRGDGRLRTLWQALMSAAEQAEPWRFFWVAIHCKAVGLRARTAPAGAFQPEVQRNARFSCTCPWLSILLSFADGAGKCYAPPKVGNFINHGVDEALVSSSLYQHSGVTVTNGDAYARWSQPVPSHWLGAVTRA